MSIPVFDPRKGDGSAFHPDTGMQVTPTAKTIEVQYNDGYTQTAGAGINNIMKTYNPHWTNAYQNEGDYINSFLMARQGWQKFYWTPQGETQQLCFTCKTWNYSKASGGYWTMDATFIQCPPL